MKKSLIITVIVTAIIAAIALAGSHHGQSLGGLKLFALAAGIALVLQWIAFVPSLLASTERYYDLMGGITYVSLTVLLLLLTPAVASIGWFLGLMVIAWSTRLASFLFARARGADDQRFDDIKKNPGRFLVTWTLQGLWVVAVASPAWVAITTTKDPGLPVLFWVGLIIWIVGFSIEIAADRQKKTFRADPANKGQFITTGLWSRSRHPNYFGEILLWTGLTIAATSTFVGWQWIALISPIVTALLLTKVSGIPMLEKKADERWGGQEDYEQYKASTPVLIPRF